MKKFPLFFIVAVLSVSLMGSGGKKEEFPDFITSNEDYYITRIGDVPEIEPETYRLEVKGFIQNPGSFTLNELYGKVNRELPLTVECIGNSPSGQLVSTAIWRGFLLYDFLESLGIDENATGVMYRAADGYYASHTLEQIRNNGVLVALYMNGEPLPPLHGFPVRILNPGYYGVKQPAWVTSIEVIDRPVKDYWEDRGWDCSPPMAVDSVIFFPKKWVAVRVGHPLRIGGAVFGGTRVSRVELTSDRGKSWTDANIVQSMDADNVWAFWEVQLTFSSRGDYNVNVRATDIHGNVQQETDPDRYDGNNDWPLLRVKVN
jgi:hypothetical protein